MMRRTGKSKEPVAAVQGRQESKRIQKGLAVVLDKPGKSKPRTDNGPGQVAVRGAKNEAVAGKRSNRGQASKESNQDRPGSKGRGNSKGISKIQAEPPVVDRSHLRGTRPNRGLKSKGNSVDIQTQERLQSSTNFDAEIEYSAKTTKQTGKMTGRKVQSHTETDITKIRKPSRRKEQSLIEISEIDPEAQQTRKGQKSKFKEQVEREKDKQVKGRKVKDSEGQTFSRAVSKKSIETVQSNIQTEPVSKPKKSRTNSRADETLHKESKEAKISEPQAVAPVKLRGRSKNRSKSVSEVVEQPQKIIDEEAINPKPPKKSKKLSRTSSDVQVVENWTQKEALLLQQNVILVPNYGNKQTDIFANKVFEEYKAMITGRRTVRVPSSPPRSHQLDVEPNADSVTIFHPSILKGSSKQTEETKPNNQGSNLLLKQPVEPGKSYFCSVDSLLRTGETGTVLVNIHNFYTKEMVSRLFVPDQNDYRKLRLESIDELIRIPGFIPKEYYNRIKPHPNQQPGSSSSQNPPVETVLVLDQLRIRMYVKGAMFAQTKHTAKVVNRVENMFLHPVEYGVYFMNSEGGVLVWDLNTGNEVSLQGFCDSKQPEQSLINLCAMTRDKQSQLLLGTESIREIPQHEFQKRGNLDEEKQPGDKYHFLIGLRRDGLIEVLNTDTKQVYTIIELKVYISSELGKEQSDTVIGFNSSIIQSVGTQYFVVKQYNGKTKPMCIFIFDIDHSELVLNIKTSLTNHTVCEFFEHKAQDPKPELYCVFGNMTNLTLGRVTKAGLEEIKSIPLQAYFPDLLQVSHPAQILRGRTINNKVYIYEQLLNEPKDTEHPHKLQQ